MSYCRWSSDNYKSDIYCYEHVGGGFLIHIAGNRIIGDVPKTPSLNADNIEKYMSAHRIQMDFLRKASRAPINLPHAGESFDDPTASACADRLEFLRSIGYYVPEGVIEALREEVVDDLPDTEGRTP